ncbi:MAG: glycoside hydrolase 43 family protein [Massilia sp.]
MSLNRRDYLKLHSVLAVAAALRPLAAHAAPEARPAAFVGLWGDQGDGTFVNPILPADYSDIDAIKVGDDFYAISSTIHVSPGMVVMHSKDLVNWRTVSHAVPDLAAIGPNLDWQTMNSYGKGVWAGALRHHGGKFWLYFTSPEDGIFVTTANAAEGPWSPLHCVWATRGYDDVCPFWDDDGQAYMVMTHFLPDPATGRKYDIHLMKMAPDGRSLDHASDRIIHQSPGSEANKLYKFGNTYYHFYSEVKAEGRVPMMNRAASLAGPWETRQLNHVAAALDKEPNQGGLIEVGENNWWFLSHQGNGDWDGRALVLLPVSWIDGWPIIGAPGADGIGNMVWRAGKPVQGKPALGPITSDRFDAPVLGQQWEWNHQPRADKWSLAARKGYVRLHAFKPLRGDDFLGVGNTLSQRALRTAGCEVTVKIDISGMRDGQRAGLCHQSRSHGLLGVVQEGAARTLELRLTGKDVVHGPAVRARQVWLRSSWDVTGLSQFSFSLDGKTFSAIGPAYQLAWGQYRGDRVGVYSYNPKAEAGFIDVDRFDYAYASQTGKR